MSSYNEYNEPFLYTENMIYFKGVECGQPPEVTNTNHTHEATVSGSTAHYNCLPDFIYKTGDNVKICSDDGKWEGDDLVCQGR